MAQAQFWSAQASQAKRKFRFLITWGGMPQFIAKSVTKPGFQVGSATHSFLNHNFNFPGRVTWQDVTLTLVDPITPDATYSLYAYLRRSGYVLPNKVSLGNGDVGEGSVPDGEGTGGGGSATISKKSMMETLGNMTIDTIDEKGDIVEQWVLNNVIFTSVNFDTLDYSSDELLNITVTIKYDWAECVREAGGTTRQVWSKATADG